MRKKARNVLVYLPQQQPQQKICIPVGNQLICLDQQQQPQPRISIA